MKTCLKIGILCLALATVGIITAGKAITGEAYVPASASVAKDDEQALDKRFRKEVLKGEYPTADEFLKAQGAILDVLRKLVRENLLAPEEYVSRIIAFDTMSFERSMLKDMPAIKTTGASDNVGRALKIAAVQFPVTRLDAIRLSRFPWVKRSYWWIYKGDWQLTDLARRFVKEVQYDLGPERLTHARDIIDAAKALPHSAQRDDFFKHVEQIIDGLAVHGDVSAKMIREMVTGPSEEVRTGPVSDITRTFAE